MPARLLMIQGTSSSVGKSIITTALCRIFRQDGLRVAPFKAQNMALNSFATPDGGEIGRAQAAQAEAAGVEPTVDMNPILLKPESAGRSQVVVLGRPRQSLTALDYYARKAQLWSVVQESLDRLATQFDMIVIEGAGSPVEINLKASDIVNMRVATYANAPVLLVGDVDRGGVLAALVGTLELLEPAERDLVKGFVINKFRGDLALLQPALDFLEERTGKRVAGVVPFYHDIQVAQEDSVYLETRSAQEARVDGAALDVAVLWLPHVSNYDDFDPLAQEAGVQVRYIREAGQLGQPDLIIIPGTKSTMADLQHLRQSGLAGKTIELARAGTPVIGICGGYQILGQVIEDPDHVEDSADRAEGLGLLPVHTRFAAEKMTRQARARVIGNRGLLEGCRDLPVVGYEIRMGLTDGEGAEAVLDVEYDEATRHLDGALDRSGLVFGTYLHGIFDNTDFRRALLSQVARRHGREVQFGQPLATREEQYDRLADWVRGSLDMNFVREICGIQ